MSANDLNIVDIIPPSDSGETGDNSEPSIGVNPANPMQLIAASFGGSLGGNAPYFVSTDGGSTWSTFGALTNSDKTIAWVPNGSAVLTATLVGPDEPLPLGGDPDEGGSATQLNMYSASQSEVMTSGGNFGSPINNFVGSDNNDQPWLRISPDGQVYMAYNDLGASGGKTASVNVSTDGGASYAEVISLDRVGGGPQDDPAIRLAVSGTTTYAIFDRWNTRIENDAYGSRYDATLVVDKSVIGGADDFSALGADGNGADVTDHVGVFTRNADTQLTIGLNRIAGGDLAIAVDPNNANHVVVAYIDGPGFDGAGVVQLVVAESEDGGTTWSQKYTTSDTVRASQPGLAILDDGTIGFLYDAYDPSTNELSQHFVTTSNDFASTNNFTLGTETNNVFPTYTGSPYLGDFFDLSSVGDTFYGIFSALNFDNGNPTTGATFTNITFQRDITGTPGTSSFQLTDSSGRAVSESVDPFAFTLSGAGTAIQFVSSGVVSTGVAVTSGNVLEVRSGGTASVTSVDSSGTEQVDFGGRASGTRVSGGGIEVVYGSETGAALRGGTLEVISGGIVSGATVSSGGTLEIWSSGTAIDTTVLSGGTLEYFDGGITSGATFSAGATLEAGAGYVASGLTVSSGLTLAVDAEGSAVSNTVLSGGSLSVLFGGEASGTVVSSGGVESISFLGSAIGTTVSNGGVQDILSGGLAEQTTVDAGGSEIVAPFGSAVHATVASGGSLTVSSGGSLELISNDTLSGVTLLSGAILLVGSGYTLSGYVVSSGITLGVLSGGTASNTTVLSGGAFEYFNGGTDDGTVFSSGAVRILGYPPAAK